MIGQRGSSEIGMDLLKWMHTLSQNIAKISLNFHTYSVRKRNQYIVAKLMYLISLSQLEVNQDSYVEADSMHSSIENANKN